MTFRVRAGLLACVCVFSSPALAGGVKLIAVRYPSSIDGTKGTQAAPEDAPLSQRVVFEFDGKPEIGPGIAEGLRIRVAAGNGAGQPIGGLAYGKYSVSGNSVLFTPRLPVVALTTSFTPASDVAGDSSLPGLLPDTIYEISVTVGTANSVKNLTGIAKGAAVPQTFRTTAIRVAFFANASPKPLHVKTNKLAPAAGATGIHPNVFHDPAGLFSGIEAARRPPFRVVFDGPVDTATENIAGGLLRLRAIRTPEGAPEDVVLGSTALLTKNTVKRADVLLYPMGILPLGHTIALEIADNFESLGGVPMDSKGPEEYAQIAHYGVALDPYPGTAVDDYLYEDFDDVVHQDASLAAEGQQAAGWDAANSNTLRASFGFGGDGSLGRFAPPTTQEIVVHLDTNYQTFPLFSGATPDVEPGTVVVGGVFNFTDFTLPENVKLIAEGSNPLIITATGNVLIEGRIDLNGSDGTEDDTFDSSMTPMPGGSPGPGAGKGGDSHPVTSPAGAASLKYIQTPAFGQSGYGPGNKGPGGGGGGQCGCTLPWEPFNGAASNCFSNYYSAGDGSRGSGGGGGSLNVFFPNTPETAGIPVSGRRGAIGIGNHLPMPFKPGDPIPPPPDAYMAKPGNPTNAVARVNLNPTFAQAYQQGWIWDSPPLMDITKTWPTTKRVTMYGSAGPGVFVDEDPDNNFIGPGGEVQTVIGGQGGGGAGSRTEGLSQQCKVPVFDNSGLPFTVLDARGGGGGGGGGALLVQALGTIEIRGNAAKIEAKGGRGKGGEEIGMGSRGGSGGGGSGGAVILQSAVNVKMNDPALVAVVIDVSGGCGHNASVISSGATTGVTGGDSNVLQCFDGGPGGPGIVQIHKPPGAPNLITGSKINAKINASVFNITCASGGLSDFNPLVPMESTPTPLTSKSSARSTWYDLGAVTRTFRPPLPTSAGPLDGPIFGVPGVGPFFHGTSTTTGKVLTDGFGCVLDPGTNDFDVDAPDEKVLLADFIPEGPLYYQSVAVYFQGADEDPANPGMPDLATASGFVSDITLLNGRRFIRWAVRFDIATNPAFPAQPDTPRPQMNFLRVPFKY
ncbi:MAG: hypothetical protein HY812_09245 [Planctomycetes bacterium]|nr:hypothetical protein [Planctomycetota bacterium]